MVIQVKELRNKRTLDFYKDRLPGKLPMAWENHFPGSLQEVMFPKPDGFIQEVYDDRIGEITPQNSHLKAELESHYPEYVQRGLKNGTLFTLRLMGTGKMIQEARAIDVERLNLANMWNLPHAPQANMAVMVFGLCSYYEQVAMVEGAVEGMQPTYAALISASTVTSDNNLVFARRVGQAHNKIGIIGGTLNEDEQKIGKNKYKTPDQAMGAEATEELGLTPEQFVLQLRAVISDRITNKTGTFTRPVLFYDLNLLQNKRQLENVFNNSVGVHKEHSELIFIPNNVEGILQFMKDHDPAELHPPADAVLSIALERAVGLRAI